MVVLVCPSWAAAVSLVQEIFKEIYQRLPCVISYFDFVLPVLAGNSNWCEVHCKDDCGIFLQECAKVFEESKAPAVVSSALH